MEKKEFQFFSLSGTRRSLNIRPPVLIPCLATCEAACGTAPGVGIVMLESINTAMLELMDYKGFLPSVMFI